MTSDRELVDRAIAAGKLRRIPMGARALKPPEQQPEVTAAPRGFCGNRHANLSSLDSDFQ